MTGMDVEVRAFQTRKARDTDRGRQIAALQLICGLDFATLLAAPLQERKCQVMKIELMLRRERLKGLRRHWSYDLNRHIALKQALDCLRMPTAGETMAGR